ncbi:MAG: ABC transporter ATP-binding protein/permease [bacterium]|nr:ABC transporter ATP-binding protein/permease [bacterium]
MEEEKIKFNRYYVKRLLSYLKPYTLHLILALLIIFGLIGVSLYAPLVMKITIDNYIMKGDYIGMLRMIALLVGIYIASWILSNLRTRILALTGQKVIFKIRQELFEHLQNLSFKFYDNTPVGKIVTRLTSDIDAMSELVSGGIINVISELVMLVGIVYMMFRLHIQLTWAVLATLPLLIYMFAVVERKLLESERNVRTTATDMNINLEESISGVRVIQAYNREEYNLERFKDYNEKHYNACLNTIRYIAILWPGVEVFWVLASIVVVGLGGYWLIKDTITVGIITAFISYIGNFFGPIRSLSQFLQIIQRASAGAEKVFSILDTEVDIKDQPNATELPPVEGRVEFRDVYFSYDGSEIVLKGINLTVEPGQTVAIVGHTGAGKTSLVNLLCRFYEPTSGSILIDGYDIKSVTLKSLRRQIGVVLQEPFLFSGTIRDNMKYGKETAQDDEIWRALDIIGAGEFVRRLPNKLDTTIGERGISLSMGQRQLLSFARVILADPRIIVLDEATSNIDTETEQQIQSALRTLLKGRTAFIIAHRLSTIREADLIVVIENGKIVERGTHSELLALGGIYYRMNVAQFDPALISAI